MHDNLTSKAQTQHKTLQYHNELDLLSDMRAVLRIRDVYPVYRILIFIHPGSRIQQKQQKRGKNFLSSNFFGCQKHHKIEHYLFLNR
jgi:hypothetical protein